MNEYKFLHNIQSLCPGNLFTDYIVDRVVSDDYRGVQCSQHNRLTFEYFSNLITAIYSIANDQIFHIHIGDDNGIKQPLAYVYYQVVDKIKETSGKGTVNSVKKNTFPDIARMGFLNRYDNNGNKIIEGISRANVYAVGLSPLGCKFAKASVFEKIKLFTDGIDILTQNTASELVETLYLNEFDIEYIDILEFMYIFSDNRRHISTNDKLRLLLEYRKLSPHAKAIIDENLKLFCNPKNRRNFGSKTALRDYSNWKNESQQIFGLLANSTYFKVQDSRLMLNTGNYGLFDENPTRGTKAKSDYFKKHNVDRTPGYDLHHIVPFSKVHTKSDATYIDDYKNLIYLKEKKHEEFTINGSKHIILRHNQNNPNLLFLTFDNSFILVNIDTDALISNDLLPMIRDYNEKLIKKFY